MINAGLMSPEEVARVLSPSRLSGLVPITSAITVVKDTVPQGAS